MKYELKYDGKISANLLATESHQRAQNDSRGESQLVLALSSGSNTTVTSGRHTTPSYGYTAITAYSGEKERSVLDDPTLHFAGIFLLAVASLYFMVWLDESGRR